MARRTDIVRIAVTGRERGVLGVIKCRARPGSCVVTGLAGRREKLRLRRVSRIRRVVVIGLMTADTGRGQSRVVVVDMAVRTDAWRHRVRASQGEGCVVVIESGVGPDGRVVTKFARGRETGRGVGRIRRAGVILLVARVAECAVERVIVVDVTIRALPRWNSVRPRQLESGAGVVESAIGPENSVMAAFARRGESRRDVVHRRGCIVVIVLVAGDARRAGQVVIVVNVTIGTLARRNGVRSGQGKSGAVVVKSRVQPGRRVVALIACLGEVGRNVIRIGRALVVSQVATHARRIRDVVVVVDVTVGALARWNGMHSRQREPGAIVIE